MQKLLEYTIEEQVVTEGYDRKTGWFQPRIGWMPPGVALLTMTRNQLWGSDIFTAIHTMRSDDGGRTWSEPIPEARMDRRLLADGYEVCPCDMTPLWHAASGKLLATGHTAVYKGGKQGGLSADNSHRRDLCYAVYDPTTQAWSQWQIMSFTDPDTFFWAGAGCTQRVDLEDGTILLPVYATPRATEGSSFWKSCYFSSVVRVAFDGTVLRQVEQGDTLSVPDPRGFCEPSLTRFQGRYFLTLRNDIRGYVARGSDGLHFDKPEPWKFDNGEELGSYNTQQHWVTHSDGLFLVYTRRGANNDHIIRHRAPLFMAQVDPDRLCVLRDTEKILVPNRGAQLGNFGTVNVSPDESWVVTSECMQGDAQNHQDLALTESRGANNRVIIARIRWNTPNALQTTR